jgi:5-methylcytosine-specific restriction endonuclease McrA
MVIFDACLAPTGPHVVPGAAGGEWLAESNLVTACWPCNVRKAVTASRSHADTEVLLRTKE